ncbi:MAG: ABC transporter permease subunit [Acidimicrobiales bacterium]
MSARPMAQPDDHHDADRPTGVEARVAADAKPPPWRNVRVLAWVFQLAALALAALIIGILVNNVRVNSANIGIPTDFSFLDQPAGFEIPGNSMRSTQPVRDAIVQGTLNTLRVVVVGIMAATVLGTAIGMGRLSGNYLVRTVCRVYVEIIRNVPLLGLLVFAYLGLVLNALPPIDDPWQLGSLLIVSNRGLAVPWLVGNPWALLGVIVIAAVAGRPVMRWRQRKAAATGAPAQDLLWGGVVFVGLVLVGFLLVGDQLSTPAVDGRRIDGGIVLQPEYFALLAALVIYTASHIAEIVRGSIQAVPRGQFEAAAALALGSWARMRRIILPQAFRIALPAIGNQYLNLLKNSSLGFAVSYFELTKVTTTAIGNRAPAVPAYIVLIAIYLSFSLVVSILVNLANRRLQVVDR